MTIVTIADRPDLIPIVADWLWRAFWRDDGYSLDHTTEAVAASASRSGPPQAFVLLIDGQPVGTASLVRDDLDERPELTPWLAGMFVAPEARGRGYAARLIAAVEEAARSTLFPVAWLYTNNAQGLYEKTGWQAVDVVERKGRPPVTLMVKHFNAFVPGAAPDLDEQSTP